MKRIFYSILFVVLAYSSANAQTFMNEWVDYNKTYYKFAIGSNGIYRISQSQLSSLGLGTVDASSFQLWRNGEEVPLYTSVNTGNLPVGGFIEFWGEASDGKWEKRLYLKPKYQINELTSLFTDSAYYFLTVNTTSPNKRITAFNNDLSSPLTAESYFVYKSAFSFRNQYNVGFAAVVGEYVYSASYDEGEGYTSLNATPSSPVTSTLNNLFVSPTGPDAKVKFSVVGRALNTRNVRVRLNNTIVKDLEMNYFNSVIDSSLTSVPLSLISSSTATFQFQNLSPEPTDRMLVGMYELTYPRLFNFGGQSNFVFEMPASPDGNRLSITNFNYGSVAPVLYDLTNGLRITADISTPGEVKVVLPPSETSRKLVLVSMDNSNVKSISRFSQRSFVNYSLTSNQADYIIISNPIIYFDQNGINQVDEYRKYRSSSVGGGFNAKVYDITQLIDQFGYGIKNNPLSIRNFLRYARQNFTKYPEFCLLIGKGVAQHNLRSNELTYNNLERLGLVPTFGVPQSDVTLSSDEGSIVPKIPIGRLNVVSAKEVKGYLDKVKEYEGWYSNPSCKIDDEFWKKSVIHIGGANDFLGEQIMYYLAEYKNDIQDTLFGGNVSTFQKSSLASVQTLSGEAVGKLFTNGFSLMTYFGHSSANTLEFNLDNPENYPYNGKYPIFLVNGCNAGNLFQLDSLRLTGSYTLSEKYVVASPQRGSIAFIASTHLGIVNYLHLYTEQFYKQMNEISYGKPIGRIISNVIDTLMREYTIEDFYVRMHAEEITLHGDPAIKFYAPEKPDYAIEPSLVKISPEFISIADTKFKVQVKMANIGKAIADSVHILVQREFPDGRKEFLVNQKMRGIRSLDSINLELPINPITDKGRHVITVVIDGENQISEICESNNTVTKEFFIYEDEIRPTYPYNYGIVNKQNITYYASTANPLGSSRKYYFEIDTTQNFNSSIKKIDSVTSVGGSIAFKPSGLTLRDSTVYYWRVGLRNEPTGTVLWNTASFIYRNPSTEGFNQSHYFQFLNNDFNDIFIDPVKRDFEYKNVNRKLKIKTGLFPYFNSTKNLVFLDLQQVDAWRCGFNVFSIYVFEPKILKSWINTAVGSEGRFGSLYPLCLGYDRKFFEFPMEQAEYRNRARLMLEQVPQGSVVLIVNQGTGEGGGFVSPNSAFVQQWQNDTLIYGSGNSIYHTFIKNGLSEIDKFTKNLPFAFVYEKGNTGFVRQFIGETERDYIDVVVDVPAQLYEGTVETPWLGPAKSWDRFQWEGDYPGGRNPSDSLFFEIYGKSVAGNEVILGRVTHFKDTSINYIDAKDFPYLKMRMYNSDPVTLTPFQLRYWRLLGEYVPEGAIAPNIKFQMKDTVELGEPLVFTIAFKNVSETAFDSLKLKLILTDKSNVPVEIPLSKTKKLLSGDTILVSYTIDTKKLAGLNSLYLMVNPDDDQPEQFLFNNFVYKSFYVKPDLYHPWLDVTFDGTHILNRDIVSSKPHILIKLKDDSKYMTLTDTAGIKVRVKYPDRTIKEFRLGTDSARFTPAGSGADNTAIVDLYPFFTQDGEYELYVSGTDRSGNTAGNLEYNVAFQVINKPMISNLLNYPNPFTTSTAFVFTLTGSEVPQNMRIQILTVTGKVVREITKAELGPIRIGRNITEYKWDGTDQYGNKLANGIYLYRVITNLNGKGLEQYKDQMDNTDQYFKKGYGKMYLMR